MSKTGYFEPLKRTHRNWLRKRNRILPSEVASPFFHARDIYAVRAYFSASREKQKISLKPSSSGLRGKCYLCKKDVEFAVDIASRVNWRETCTCPECGLINRWRGCLHVFEELCEPTTRDRIYLTESLSLVYRNLAARFSLLSSSEYLPDADFGELTTRYDEVVRNEDVTNLAFADASMDIVLCFDVLEHVSDYRSALKEFYRVLGAGGQLVLSVPFSGQHETFVRATLDGDGIVNHMVEPCYHGDPLSDQGVLSYYDFGMDLLDEMREAGFEECFLLCFSAEKWGYPDDNVVFIGRKLKSSANITSLARSAWQRTHSQVGLIVESLGDVLRYSVRSIEKFTGSLSGMFSSHSERIIRSFDEVGTDVIAKQDLPEIFHYWSNRFIVPEMNRFGFDNPDDFFFQHTRGFLKGSKDQIVKILSIGWGDCSFEIKLVETLLKWHSRNFVLECLRPDSNDLEVGRKLVDEAGLGEYFLFSHADLNNWKPYQKYGVVLANQSLHAVYELEGLFDSVKRSLKPGGLFIISEMIGRNVDMRWPESVDALKPFWDELPESHRFNRVLNRQEQQFINPDGVIGMSGGVRSQDILPLLIERFKFKFFFPYGNIIYVFVDKTFGHSFDASAEWDKDFVDRVHAFDEAAIISGELTPDSMLAVLTREKTELVLRHPVLTPQHCVRKDPVCGGVDP